MELALAGSFILVITYNLFFYQIPTGIGFGFFVLLTNIFFFLSSRTAKSNKLIGAIYGTISTTFAFLLSLRANMVVQNIDFLATAFFSLAALYTYRFPKNPELKVSSFLISPLKTVFSAIFNFTSNLKVREFKNFKSSLSDDAISAMTKGIITAVPIVIILFIILQAADPVFATISGKFFKNIGNRFVFSTILFAVLLAFGAVRIYSHKESEEESIKQSKAIEQAIILGAITLLFAAFIVVEFQYLFSQIDERQLHTLGVKSLTYSEYVRKGFFELLLAASIASLVVINGIKSVHKFIGGKKYLIQILLGALTVETGLILLSAGQRLNLYQMEHGLTRARVFGFDFLLWLGAILLILLLQIIYKQKKETIFVPFLAVSIIAVLAINLINVDKLIAIDWKPTVNKEVDYSYISSLSPDAYQVWREIISNSQQLSNTLEKKSEISQDELRKLTLARISLDRIQSNASFLIRKYGSESIFQEWFKFNFPEIQADRPKRNWHSLNFSEQAAYKDIENNLETYKQIKPTFEKISAIENIYFSNPQNQSVPLDRPIDTPLTF